MKLDYRTWQSEYEQMPLFYNVSGEEAVKLLEAMQPRLYTVKKGSTIMDGYDSKYMYLCVNGRPAQWREPRRSQWALPCGVDRVGILCGEVMTLSEHDHLIGPQSHFEPSPIEADYLMLSLDAMMEPYEGQWPAQKQMLRNLMGIVAQVVIETRALFYKARHGIDMYSLAEGEREKYPEIHSDPLNEN